MSAADQMMPSQQKDKALDGERSAYGRLFPWLPLVAAAAGAVLFHNRSYVGFVHDDASFVLLAQKIFAALSGKPVPGLAASFSHFLPGYPVFLTPFVALLEPHWGWLRWTTAGVSLLTVYGLWRLLADWLPEEERRWVVLLCAVHPLFLMDSGLVMADPFLSCLFVYGLLGLRLVLEGGGAPAYALLFGAAVWAAAAKPIGILLPAAVTAGLLAAGEKKALRLAAAFIWLPLLAAALYAVHRNNTPTDYVSYMLQGLASLAHQGAWDRLYGLFYTFVLQYGLAYPLPRGPYFDIFGTLLISGVLYLCGKGISALLSGAAKTRFVALSACLLLIGQGLVMTLWTFYSERYALLMLPLGLLFLAAGSYAALKTRPAARALLGAAAIGFFCYSAWLAREINSDRRPIDSRLCARTLDWIRRETPPGSRFFGDGALLELYTGRTGQSMFSASDADYFLACLSRLGITYAMIVDLPILSPRGPYSNNQALQKITENSWVRGHPRLYQKVFSDPEERTEIYSVKVPARWNEAVTVYAGALEDVRNSKLPAAEEKLRLALAAVPDFPSALTALAGVRLMRGGGTDEAEKLLRRALALEPDYQRAWGMLVRLLELRGRAREALEARAAAQAELSGTAFEAPL